MTDISWMRPRLAELCGLILVNRLTVFDPTADIKFILRNDWHPDLDVAQTIRCFEAWRGEHERGWKIEQYRFGTVIRLYCNAGMESKTWKGSDVTLAEAGCLALAAALGWEKT